MAQHARAREQNRASTESCAGAASTESCAGAGSGCAGLRWRWAALGEVCAGLRSALGCAGAGRICAGLRWRWEKSALGLCWRWAVPTICHTPGKKLKIDLNRSGLSLAWQETQTQLELDINRNVPVSVPAFRSATLCSHACAAALQRLRWGSALGLRLRWAALALGCAGKSCAGLALALGCAGAGLR